MFQPQYPVREVRCRLVCFNSQIRLGDDRTTVQLGSYEVYAGTVLAVACFQGPLVSVESSMPWQE